MKNLNKFSKAELITKLKNNLDQNQKQSKINKFIDLIFTFKSIILKITLITFIIRWIKKYSLIAKLWHLFSIIGSSLLGLSMIDIYVLDLINWIQNTSIYRWYFELFKYTKPIDKTDEDLIILVDSLAYVQQSYDAQVGYYLNNKERLNHQDLLALKGGMFHLREWIQNYQSEILPELPKFEVGLSTDEPIELFKVEN